MPTRRRGGDENGMYSRNKSKGVMSFLKGMKSTAKSVMHAPSNAFRSAKQWYNDREVEKQLFRDRHKGGRRSRRRR
jgi:hypothetical protein